MVFFWVEVFAVVTAGLAVANAVDVVCHLDDGSVRVVGNDLIDEAAPDIELGSSDYGFVDDKIGVVLFCAVVVR